MCVTSAVWNYEEIKWGHSEIKSDAEVEVLREIVPLDGFMLVHVPPFMPC